MPDRRQIGTSKYGGAEISDHSLRICGERAKAFMRAAGAACAEPTAADIESALRRWARGNVEVQRNGEVYALQLDACDEIGPDAFRLLAIGAEPDDYLLIWDTTNGARDIYEVLFDGQGSYSKSFVVNDGVLVDANDGALG